MTLTEFLLARIDEDEEAATYVNRGLWTSRVAVLDLDLHPLISRHHPERVLAECEAKRRIVQEHSPIDPCDAHDANFESVPCDTLRHLAAVYADHPEYQEAWRV